MKVTRKIAAFVLIALFSTSMLSSCTGLKKSKCQECPEFTEEIKVEEAVPTDV